MKVVRYNGEPYYECDVIGYQLQVTEIPKSFNLKDMIKRESKYGEEYDPDMWFVRGSYNRETKNFDFDKCLTYIGYSEYFYDYEFSDKEILEMIKVCIENTDFNRLHMQEKIWEYMEENAYKYGIDIDDINEVEIYCVEENINEFNMSLEQACDEMLEYIQISNKELKEQGEN